MKKILIIILGLWVNFLMAQSYTGNIFTAKSYMNSPIYKLNGTEINFSGFKLKSDTIHPSGYATQYDLDQISSLDSSKLVTRFDLENGLLSKNSLNSLLFNNDGFSFVSTSPDASIYNAIQGGATYNYYSLTKNEYTSMINDEFGNSTKLLLDAKNLNLQAFSLNFESNLHIDSTELKFSIIDNAENETNVIFDTAGLRYNKNLSLKNTSNPRWITDKNYVDSVSNFTEEDPIYSASDASGISSSNISSWNAKEPSLGNPSVNGYVLSSTTSGTRSWIPQTGGSAQWTVVGNNIQFPNNTNNYYVGLGTYTTTIAAPLHLYFDDPSIRIQERINNNYWDILTEAGSGDFRISTSAHPSAIHVVNSTGYTGIGKTPTKELDVNGAINASGQISSSSYITQQGIYAGIYVSDASTAQSIANGTTYIKSTAFTTNGLSSNCTSDAVNDKITITKTGKYLINGTCSFASGTNNVIWRSSAFLGGTEQSNIHWSRKVGTAGDVGSASFMGLINVASVPVDLDVRFRHDQAGATNITVEYSNLTVIYIGE